MLRFDEFCDYVKDNIRAYMSEMFQKNNFEFCLDESKDSYDMVNSLLRIVDKQDMEASVPVFHLDAAYENYKQTNDVDAIVVMLAGKYEAAYLERQSIGEKQRPEFEVFAGEGVSNAFIISNLDNTEVDLYQDDVLIEISTKENGNLLLIPINEGVLMAVPVKGSGDYRECMECIAILKIESEEYSQKALQPKLYDRENNIIVSNVEKIKETLSRMDKEQKNMKRSVFARK